ncbi:MAG: ComEC/Rec2 family competence protein [Candidatus Microsaccharimonas sp.]
MIALWWQNSSPILLALSVALLIMALWRRRVYCTVLCVLGGILLGCWYGSLARGELEVYAPLFASNISITGNVKEDPTRNTKNQLVLQLDRITVHEHQLAGTVWVSLIGNPDIKRGDIVMVSGIFEKGFGTFAGVIFTAKVMNIQRPEPGDVGRKVRDWFASAIRRAIPEPQASLGIGYLTGQKSALPTELSEALQIAGLSHVVVASGYNLTILVRLARRLFMRISKFVSAFASSIMIASFVAMTGLSPSMTRAGLVSGLSLLSWYYGRRFHPFVLLPLAAAITVAFQPSYAWGDVGWQLSFSAFAAVMIVGPLLQRFFFGEKEPGTIRQILGETVAAHMVTIPIIVASFGIISNVAIIANIMIVPLVPLAMLLTFISGIAALVMEPIASIIALPATWLLTYMTTTAQYLADLPWAQTEFSAQWWMIILYYVMLVVACVVMQRVSKFQLREVNIVA